MADADVSVKFAADTGGLNTGLDQATASLQGFSNKASESLKNAGAAMDDLGERHTMVLIRTFGELGRSVTEGGLSFNKLETAALHLSLMLGESGGIAAAAKLAGSAILGVLTNPVTLATIALVGATEAAGLFFSTLTGDDTKKVDAQLKSADALIKEIEKDWDGATAALKNYGKESTDVLTFQLDTQIAQLGETLNSQLDKISGSLNFQTGGFLGKLLGTVGADFGPFDAIVDKLKASLESGVTPDLAAVREEIAKLANTDPTNQALQGTAQALMKITDAADKTQIAIGKLKEALTQAPDLHAMDTMRQAMAGSTVTGVDFAGRFGDDPTKKQADEARNAMLAEMSTKLQVDDVEIGSERTKIDTEFSLGQISVSQKFAQLQDLADKKYSLDRQELDAELAVGNLSVQQHQAILDKLAVLDAKYRAEKAALDQQAQIAAQTAQDKQIGEVGRVASSFLSIWNSNLSAVLQGTESWSMAFSKTLDDLLLKVITTVEEIVVEWGILEAIALATGMPAPSIGTVAKSVLGFHADGAYNVPRTELAVLHPGEMVLDSTSAGITRGMLEGNGGGVGGGATNLNVSFNISAMDTQTGYQFVQKNIQSIAMQLKGYLQQNPSAQPNY